MEYSVDSEKKLNRMKSLREFFHNKLSLIMVIGFAVLVLFNMSQTFVTFVVNENSNAVYAFFEAIVESLFPILFLVFSLRLYLSKEDSLVYRHLTGFKKFTKFYLILIIIGSILGGIGALYFENIVNAYNQVIETNPDLGEKIIISAEEFVRLRNVGIFALIFAVLYSFVVLSLSKCYRYFSDKLFYDETKVQEAHTTIFFVLIILISSLYLIESVLELSGVSSFISPYALNYSAPQISDLIKVITNLFTGCFFAYIAYYSSNYKKKIEEILEDR